MIMLQSVRRQIISIPSKNRLLLGGRTFGSTTPLRGNGNLADRCDKHVISSPYASFPKPCPYPSVPEFVMSQWKLDNTMDQIAITDGSTGMQRTYHDWYQDTHALAATFADMIPSNTSVCVLAPNHVDYLPVLFATGLVGEKVTPVNPMSKPGEVQTVLERSQSSVIVAHPATLAVALEAAKNASTKPQVIVLNVDNVDASSTPEGVLDLNSLKQSNEKGGDFPQKELDTERDPFLLPYSSGTTGLPKGVCLTHSNIVANLIQFSKVEEPFLKKGERIMSPLPFFHIYGLTVSLLYGALRGNPIVTLSAGFDLPLFLQLIQDEQTSRAHLVPPILLALAQHPLIDQYDVSSLKCILSAAAPLGFDIEQKVSKRLNVVVKQGWGMSELSPIGTFQADTDTNKSGSIGPLVADTYGKIIDDEGNSLPPNEPGELCIKGPQVMTGYYQDDEKTAECKSDSGWLRTGDMVQYDEDGHFYITDRIKELIKVRGYAVAPAELEALLLTHDSITDVAVIPNPSPEHGELPRAYVVLKEGASSTMTEQDIYDWVKPQVASYKKLDGGIVLCSKIPKSASGKILRRLLRDELAAQ